MSSYSTKRPVPNIQLPGGLQTVPGSATNLTSTDTMVFQVFLANKTAGAVTVTITDRQTSAKSLLGAVSVAANSSLILNFEEGVNLVGGLAWSASAASSIDAEIVAFRRP